MMFMTSSSSISPISLRPARPDDDALLARLSELDSAARPVVRPALVALRDGRAVAAISLRDGRVVADPFEPTREVVALLTVHARSGGGSRGERRGWRFPPRPARPLVPRAA
jgi:hypothetical protein